MGLAADVGGRGGPLLVLLHGLGATREVWRGVIDETPRRWPGRWAAFDLPGHGRSPPASDYALARQAEAVAEGIKALAPASPVVVLGHSLGGAVALALAARRLDMSPARTFALGVKVTWSAEELAALAARAAAAPQPFATAEAAITRHLKMSGLAGLVDPRSEIALAGVAPAGDQWRLAMDPAANGVGAPDMTALIADASSSLSLACGEHDALVSVPELQRWDPRARRLAGLGHNAMVEAPEAIWTWLTDELCRSGDV